MIGSPLWNIRYDHEKGFSNVTTEILAGRRPLRPHERRF